MTRRVALQPYVSQYKIFLITELDKTYGKHILNVQIKYYFKQEEKLVTSICTNNLKKET